MHISRILAFFGLVILGIEGRLLPHPPNFTPMDSIALLGTLYLGNCWLALAAVYTPLLLSDLALGFHSTMPFVHLSFALIVMIGHYQKDRMSVKKLPLHSCMASFLFFFITNFGVWWTSHMYPMTLAGLGTCYTLAIPLQLNRILGDLVYGLVLYSLYAMWKNYHESSCPRVPSIS